MTADFDDKQSDGEDPPGKANYDVGYGKPPAEHRFKKGQSGNPRGRPRRPRGPNPDPLGLPAQRLNQVILQEAYRLVNGHEGDRAIELPVIQAIIRQMNASALKGHGITQRWMVERVASAESEVRKLRVEESEATSELKREESRLEQQERANAMIEDIFGKIETDPPE